MTVYCINRSDLFMHSCMYHDTFVVWLHVRSFCVFCVEFISCLLRCWCLCKFAMKKHRKYHDEITKNMKWHLQENFWHFLQLYFCCLMQLCVILKCKFVYSAAWVSPYFFCQRFWFVLSMLLSKFSIAFRLRPSIFFCWWCLEHPIWSLADAHNFDTNFLLF